MSATTASLNALHRVKVCGMTQPKQVAALSERGVAFAGFIFYAKSPRYVFNHMTKDQIKNINSINKVGVFVNTLIEEVIEMIEACGLSIVQLHGDESPEYCEALASHATVMKAFRISDQDNVERMLKPYMNSCEMFLFDTMGSGYGGTGKKFDWSVLKNAVIEKPYFLSGGIELSDVEALALFAKEPAASFLYAIDINSKFEVSPGVKDLDKVNQFVNNIKTII